MKILHVCKTENLDDRSLLKGAPAQTAFFGPHTSLKSCTRQAAFLRLRACCASTEGEGEVFPRADERREPRIEVRIVFLARAVSNVFEVMPVPARGADRPRGPRRGHQRPELRRNIKVRACDVARGRGRARCGAVVSSRLSRAHAFLTVLFVARRR